MKIACLVSGGVDSSVALSLLKSEDNDLTGFYIKIWLEDEMSYLGASCPWEEDLNYVKKVCALLDVPLKVVSMQKEYFEKVVTYTISEVKKGRTPNPDVLCNNQIKFGLFLKKYGKNFDKVASGHYSQIVNKYGKYFLKRANDPIKDQTYFLANLKQNLLNKIIFPVGNLRKEQVRKIAEKLNLPNKDRKDSQGICFLGKLKYPEFIKHYLGIKKGDFVEFETGNKVGIHEGYWFYTLGQRKNIQLSGGPWFVIKKDIKKNIVYISKNYHSKEKVRNKFEVVKLNMYVEDIPQRGVTVKIRHGEKEYKCKVRKISDKKLEVILNKNDQGISPGQFAVFFKNNLCLGSGTIA